MLRDFDDKIIKATWQSKITNSKQRSTIAKVKKHKKTSFKGKGKAMKGQGKGRSKTVVKRRKTNYLLTMDCRK